MNDYLKENPVKLFFSKRELTLNIHSTKIIIKYFRYAKNKNHRDDIL